MTGKHNDCGDTGITGRYKGEVPEYAYIVDRCVAYMKEAGCSDRVINHVLLVEKVSEVIMSCLKNNGVSVDAEIVIPGAVLHDIGRGVTHGIRHAVEGAMIARELKLNEPIVSVIENHIGGGIDKNEAAILGLPVKDYFPTTIEEKIVSHADNLVADNRIAGINHAIEKFKSRGLFEAVERIRKLHEELSLLCKKDIDCVIMERINDKSLFDDEILRKRCLDE